MGVLYQFLIFTALGIAFSVAFILLKKVNFGKITRFAVDFSLTLSLCLAFYGINYLFNYGQLVGHSFVGVIFGFISPRLFIKN